MKLYDEGLIQAKFYPLDAIDIEDGDTVITLLNDKREELLDILSLSDIPQADGKMVFLKNGSMLRRMVHSEGAPHMAAHIWIFNSRGEILLQKRAHNKDSYPDLWDISAAGHIPSGETMLNGAMREITEELGIKELKEENLIPIGYYREEVKFPMKGYENGWHNNELDGIFLLQYDGRIEDLSLQSEEVADVRFAPVNQVANEWSDPTLNETHVPKSQDYRMAVLSEIQKRVAPQLQI